MRFPRLPPLPVLVTINSILGFLGVISIINSRHISRQYNESRFEMAKIAVDLHHAVDSFKHSSTSSVPSSVALSVSSIPSSLSDSVDSRPSLNGPVSPLPSGWSISKDSFGWYFSPLQGLGQYRLGDCSPWGVVESIGPDWVNVDGKVFARISHGR